MTSSSDYFPENPSDVTQNHSGRGDNVGRDKTEQQNEFQSPVGIAGSQGDINFSDNASVARIINESEIGRDFKGIQGNIFGGTINQYIISQPSNDEIGKKFNDYDEQKESISFPFLNAETESEHLKPSTIKLEIPEGQVPLKSIFYVERPPIEVDCSHIMVTAGSLIRIKAPRQMGKSSLMMRILHQGKQAGYHAVPLNFQLVDDEYLANLDRFLKWFCVNIADELNLSNQLDQYWQDFLGSKKNCTNYFQKYLLKKLDSPLVLGLDEVDQVFRYPNIASGFFSLLRTWHENGKNDITWQNLRLVIVHSKEVYIPLDINQSPFNVGYPIDLPELTLSQVEDLARRHGLEWSVEQIELIMNMLGGHPYLLRVAFYEIARGRMTLTQLLQVAPTEEGLYQDHLRRHLLNLEEDRDLLTAFKQVVSANYPIQICSSATFKLRSMGLVKLQGDKVMPLCQLYRLYFSSHLGFS